MDDFAPLIERAFSLEVSESSYEIEEVEGTIPDFIRGTYYLNGPARFSRGDFKYKHWLDGDGMVCALRFDGGRPYFTNRFVRSTKFAEEKRAGRPLFRTFGTAFEGDRLKRGLMLESPVNVSVFPYQQTLLAFGEQGLPVELLRLPVVALETREHRQHVETFGDSGMLRPKHLLADGQGLLVEGLGLRMEAMVILKRSGLVEQPRCLREVEMVL